MTESPYIKPPQILPATFFAAGQLFESQGQRNRAINQYRKATAVNHEYVAAYHRLGLILSAAGQRAEALAALQRAVDLKPKSAQLRNNLGFELMLHERWSDALDQFDHAIETDPRFVRAFINRGMALCRLDRMDEALVSFRAVLPEADAHYNLGLMLRGLGRYVEAARAFTRAVDIDPYFTSALWQLREITPRLEAKVWAPPIFLEPEHRPFPVLVERPRVDIFAASQLAPIRDELPKMATPLEEWVSAKVDDFRLTETLDGPWRDTGLSQLERFVSATPSPVPVLSPLEGFAFEGPPSIYEMDEILAIVQNEIECLEEMEFQQQLAIASVDEQELDIRTRLANARIDEFDTPVYPSIECRADEFFVSYATWVGTELDEIRSTCASDVRMAMEWGYPVDAVTVGPVPKPRPTLGLKILPKGEQGDDDGPIYDNKGYKRGQRQKDVRPKRVAPKRQPQNKTPRKLKGKSSVSKPRNHGLQLTQRQIIEMDEAFNDLLAELSVVENDTQCLESSETSASAPIIENRAAHRTTKTVRTDRKRQEPVRH